MTRIGVEPLVSVGIASYNRLERLRTALACIRNQSYRNLEIIVSDNCSPAAEIDAYLRCEADDDPRIVYVRQATNIGSLENFRFLLRAATADYFMWAADDDYWEPDFVAACMAAHLANRNTGLAFTRYERMDLNGRNDRDVIDMTEYNGAPRWPLVRRILFEPEFYGRVNCFYGVWNVRLLRRLMALPFTWSYLGWDHAITLAAMARGDFHADGRTLYKKRGDTVETGYLRVDYANPKPEHSLSFLRQPATLKCYLVALSGTRYFAIGTLLLGLRLVREVGRELRRAVRKVAVKLGLAR